MKNLTISLILMILSSSILFAQSNSDIDPNAITNPHATTFTDDLFDHQFDFICGDASGEAGIETNGDYIYTSKWNGDGFFCYEMDGTFLGWFTVPGTAAVRDMAYDGTYFYGAAANTQLFEMDFTGQSGTLISTLNAPIETRAIAYSYELDAFYANNWSTPITLYDRSGNILNQFDCGEHSSYYGFACTWNGCDVPFLYGFAQSGGVNACDIVQIDLETGEETGVVFDAIGYSSTGTGIAGGLASFDTYAPGWWTLLGIIQNETIFGVEESVWGPGVCDDLKLSGIFEPNDGFGLGIENIVIGVKNAGIRTQSNFEVRYKVESSLWVTETITGPLIASETILYTFNQAYDFSAFGEYFIEAEVLLPGDEFLGNNYADKTITNWDPDQWCNYSITMWDDYGDGWNGGYVKILGDDNVILYASFYSGYGPETIDFLVENDVFLTAVWIVGEKSYECSYEIFDADGNSIFQDGFGGVEPEGGDIGYVSCWIYDFDVGIIEIISPDNGINLGNEIVKVNIHNFGLNTIIDIPVGFSVDSGSMIMEIIPGPIIPDCSLEYTFIALADVSEYGLHNIEVCTFLELDEDTNNDCLENNIFNLVQATNQTFDLSVGYQFISSYIIPTDPDMMIVMLDILNENLDFIRNSSGQMLHKIGPNWVNGIGNWIVEEGYLLKMFGIDSFTIEGESVEPSTPINLYTGYQIISYFHTLPMNAMFAFETIIDDDLDFIRNSSGQMLRKIGSVWVNGIGDCNPGDGYLVKMYSNDILVYPFLCGKPFIDFRDWQIYNSVQIGNQCWMAENLNIGTKINGDYNQTNNNIIEKYCYDNDLANCEVYGGLYQWDEMMQYSTNPEGICPDNWRLPSDDDWFELENYIDTSINNPYSIGWRGIDCGLRMLEGGSSGFEGLLSGYRNWNPHAFQMIGERTYFMSTTITSWNSYEWYRLLENNNLQIYRHYANRQYGFSVRCLRSENTKQDSVQTSKISNEEGRTIQYLNKKNSMVPNHFLVKEGNPQNPVWTIYLEKGCLNIGDEIAVFDGEILAGACIIVSENILENAIPVFSNLYKTGNKPIIKIWKKCENKEYILTDFTFTNPYSDAWTENVFPTEDGEYSLLHFSTTGILDENVINDISIYPNPSTGIITIGNLTAFENFSSLEITDIAGKTVFQTCPYEAKQVCLDGSKIEIDLSWLETGVYFINLSGKDLKYVNKIVIQK